MIFSETIDHVAQGVETAGVLIRTFLSFSLQIEIDGRLPWRPQPDQKDG